MKKHRLGLIGCGWIAHFYARILPRLSDRVEVVWCADPDALHAGEIAHLIDLVTGATKLLYGPF